MRIDARQSKGQSCVLMQANQDLAINGKILPYLTRLRIFLLSLRLIATLFFLLQLFLSHIYSYTTDLLYKIGYAAILESQKTINLEKQ